MQLENGHRPKDEAGTRKTCYTGFKAQRTKPQSRNKENILFRFLDLDHNQHRTHVLKVNLLNDAVIKRQPELPPPSLKAPLNIKLQAEHETAQRLRDERVAIAAGTHGSVHGSIIVYYPAITRIGCAITRVIVVGVGDVINRKV